jgi:methionine-gamma-lyase
MKPRSIGFSTKAIHGRKHFDKHEPADHKPIRSISTPIFMSSTFAFESAEHGAQVFAGKVDDYFYTRMGNPTTAALESEIAYLEGAEMGLAFGSGMAAISHLMFGLVKSGEKLVYSDTVYGGTHMLFGEVCPKYFNIETVHVNGCDLDEVARAVDDRTKMLLIETPANPTLAIIDIAACAEIAHRHNAPLVVDNTFATPYLQNPIEFGADIVVHSATKYLNGPGDVVAGLLVGPKKYLTEVHHEILREVGGIISPFNSWLILRGIRSLPVRMDRHCASAAEIAKYLAFHPKVDRVYYPGLRTHPGYEIAKRQMRDFGGMVAFDIKGGRDAGRVLCNNVNLWTLAVSLGDVDSLLSHPASMTHSTYDDAMLATSGIGPGLIRLSVGLEDVDDLIDDLSQAFKKI